MATFFVLELYILYQIVEIKAPRIFSESFRPIHRVIYE